MGGWLHTSDNDGFVHELGPRSVRKNEMLPDVLRMCETLGIQDKIIPENTGSMKVNITGVGQLKTLSAV